MRARALLGIGVTMPVIYLAMLTASALLSPSYKPMADAASELGRATAPHPRVYNSGMVLTALSGACGALGLLMGLAALRRGWSMATLAALTSLSLLAACVGLAMAGLFPLPHRLHYGFGLTAAAALTPLLGSIALLRAGRVRAALALAAAFVVVVALVILRAGPLFPGVAMMCSVALFCLLLLNMLRTEGGEESLLQDASGSRV